ncbi:predicted protein [Histoplasma capsulatum var. duboisii H88]|uniref:Predicted protein n=1 Tax=Ajellomyces capsulatus (strain H88) TaxID=544711 RepID=F0UB97_AJEC8|nr:predicted protein [Histoplasma capsulatum var. duboisii H88]
MEGKPPAYDGGRLVVAKPSTLRITLSWKQSRNSPNKFPPRQYGLQLISIKGARPISIFGPRNVRSSSQKAAHLCMHKYGVFYHRSSSGIGIPEGIAVRKTGILVQVE